MAGNVGDELVARFAMGHTLAEVLPPDPMPLVREWFDLAQKESGQPNPNAMTLATVDDQGRPSARIVLCKGLDVAEGRLTFFTNYQSRKGRALEQKPHAAVLFHWDALDRQVRVEGPVVKSPAAESDAYFAGRPWESRLSAWASRQSEPIASRGALLEQLAREIQRLGLEPGRLATGEGLTIPRPPHWGGYRLWAQRVELWLGGPGRFHDRAVWTREVTAKASDAERMVTGPWSAVRLQP